MSHPPVPVAPVSVPELVAHRGASTEAPEHTYAAYVAALAAGADALECDVRLTADEHLVCVHDRRVNRTSNGRGGVSSLELARLQELDFGPWRGSPGAGEAPDREASRVLTLRRLLDLAAGQSKPVGLAIEVKHPTRHAGRVERRLIELLAQYGWTGASSPVRVMSFSQLALRRVHRLAPALPTVLLMEAFMYRARAGVLPAGVPIAGPSIEILRTRPECVERWHRAGRQVHVWTVDQPVDFERCLGLGVDAVITNQPRRMRALLTARTAGDAE